MSRESRCSICRDRASLVAVGELRSQGVPVRQIASRLKLAKSSVQRHLGHAEGPGLDRSRTSGRKLSQAGRGASGRCQTCGTALDDADPKALVKRAERLLWLAEAIAAQAQRDDDARLALQAVDRARASLEQLMKVHGLLQPEGAVNLTIDARKQNAMVLGAAPEATLRFIADQSVTLEELAACAEFVQRRRARVAAPALIGEIGTPIRDAEALISS